VVGHWASGTRILATIRLILTTDWYSLTISAPVSVELRANHAFVAVTTGSWLHGTLIVQVFGHLIERDSLCEMQYIVLAYQLGFLSQAKLKTHSSTRAIQDPTSTNRVMRLQVLPDQLISRASAVVRLQRASLFFYYELSSILRRSERVG